jgi:hypothetical protein
VWQTMTFYRDVLPQLVEIDAAVVAVGFRRA